MSGSSQSGKDASSSSAATRAELEATRARMADTLEELGARLNPDRIKQQAKDKFFQETIGRVETMAQTTLHSATGAGQKVTDVVRGNPIPAALIAAGVSWLVFSTGRRESTALSPTNRIDSSPEASYADAPGRAARGQAFEKPGIKDSLGDKAGEAVERAGEAVNATREAGRQASDKVTTIFEQHPMALAFVAAALGVAAGFAIPSTQVEAEFVGEKRDELVDAARELVNEKKAQVQQVAERVVTEAKSVATQAARESGLTGSA
ncbi:MAG TPA: DUF3618 domain-containing protein [Gemmatimonadaceae bacterium]|nr:DUF3618 domain-containing protein [Gemmatimonadaceae bacterium]